MEKVIDTGYSERKRDLWEPLIQGPANAHIHEDLELPLQLQRSLLCFPLRMPSSTPNTVRSLFLSFPSPHSSLHLSLSLPLSFSASVHLLILAPFFRRIGERVSFIYSFASHLLFLLSSLLFFSHLSATLSLPPPLFLPLTHALGRFIRVLHCVAVWIWTVYCVKCLVAYSV